MKPYIVTFFKHVLSSDGHDFNALQEKIEICADTAGQALEAAQQRFASLRGIPDWRSHADSVEISVDLHGRVHLLDDLSLHTSTTHSRDLGKTKRRS